ncbi:hypothetical protein Pst134EB_001448 [Puccinia striiformis f. sp. tritici]|uniref:RNase III domain-containing protein n=1 Tax=Puccinia striiformis f. sp. tritici PST-78 TaxID=1165861 RepID=A0A0L0UWN8_9BASI|nr:hypothetical protein Pst134EB_001448 [Puccinia striiformis f. sp. tritici]KNE91154.1 hypothetical protein PSTG_15409 [Puccinia striiformis f. sp. tritici PST-78]
MKTSQHLSSLSRFSTQAQPAASRLPGSFKLGPFRGALLTKPEQGKGNSSQGEHEKTNHRYSASQLFRPNTSISAASTRFTANSSTNSRLHFPHSSVIKQHLEELLYPLSFSDQLACRIVSAKNLLKSQDSLDILERETQGGVGFAKLGEHNTKLSFIGRRAIHFALANFLIHAPKSSTSPLNLEDPHQRTVKSTSDVLEDALLTKFVLGQYVGHQWELEKIMRWRELAPPSSSPSTSEIDASQSQSFHGTGLWTARGHVVEAIVGAVMAEHGARLSMAVFHSLVLPHLSFRLDKSYLPAIKAVQKHDHELENPKSGIIDWNHLDISPFINTNDLNFTLSSSSAPVSIAAVG